jgi:eukaryotic-like serine/threonine-protein kinase
VLFARPRAFIHQGYHMASVSWLLGKPPMELDEITAISAPPSGKYNILTELGEGGMAHVYLAVSQGLAGFNKLVVLKVLRSQFARESEIREGFLREARFCALMNHPNIVSVNEVEVLGGLPVIVMEYLQGQPLSGLLKRMLGRVPLNILLSIFVESLSGLHYAHELASFDGTPLRLVHLDFTPQNIFVTYDGSVKVLDFGVAQATRRAGELVQGRVQGKLRYMAPEQIGADTIDRRTDVFAAGVLLHELISGRRFWSGLSDDVIGRRLKSGQFLASRSVMPNFPAELARVCAKALHVDRKLRYETVAEMQRDVESFLVNHMERITPQEIGRTVSEWFSHEKEQAQQLIESSLSRAKSPSLSQISFVGFVDRASQSSQSVQLSTPIPTIRDLRTSYVPAVPMVASETRNRRWARRLSAWASGASLLGFGIVLFHASAPRASDHWVVPEAEVSAAATLPATPANGTVRARPQSITIRITAFPAAATILVDDIAFHENPLVKTVGTDEDWHELRVEAPGHETSVQQIQFMHDTERVISLEAKRVAFLNHLAPQAELPGGRKPVSGAAHGRMATRVARASCTPPFVYNEQGVKQFKPECL